ncbi:MAG: L,D-transpeptidase, partial [Candidatus Acidiferrales bacterium]
MIRLTNEQRRFAASVVVAPLKAIAPRCTHALFTLILILALFPVKTWSSRPQSERSAPARRAKSRTDAAKQQTGLRISAINDPGNRRPVGPHSQREAVVRAAILLDRLKFSPGEISITYNSNLAKAISAFQSASGLPATRNVDPATWAALNDDQSTNGQVPQKQGNQNQPVQSVNQQNQADAQQHQPKPQEEQPQQPPAQTQAQVETQALVTYIITPEDVAGPFTTVPKVSGRDAGERLMLREARFPRLNYESPLQLLAEKFHASPRLLIELNPRKAFHKAGGQILVPNVLTPDPPPAASVLVDGSARSVTALDSNGKILAFYPATVGSEHDPLPVGTWAIDEVTWYPKFKYNPNLFWDSENKKPRAILPPGPKNPVGVVWIGLSRKHYGIHGTPEPSKIGLTQSHGCIRLTNWDATELSKIVHVGTPAVLKDGANAEEKPPV